MAKAPEDDTKKKFREALERKNAKSAGRRRSQRRWKQATQGTRARSRADGNSAARAVSLRTRGAGGRRDAGVPADDAHRRGDAGRGRAVHPGGRGFARLAGQPRGGVRLHAGHRSAHDRRGHRAGGHHARQRGGLLDHQVARRRLPALPGVEDVPRQVGVRVDTGTGEGLAVAGDRVRGFWSTPSTRS